MNLYLCLFILCDTCNSDFKERQFAGSCSHETFGFFMNSKFMHGEACTGVLTILPLQIQNRFYLEFVVKCNYFIL